MSCDSCEHKHAPNKSGRYQFCDLCWGSLAANTVLHGAAGYPDAGAMRTICSVGNVLLAKLEEILAELRKLTVPGSAFVRRGGGEWNR